MKNFKNYIFGKNQVYSQRRAVVPATIFGIVIAILMGLHFLFPHNSGALTAAQENWTMFGLNAGIAGPFIFLGLAASLYFYDTGRKSNLAIASFCTGGIYFAASFVVWLGNGGLSAVL